MIILGMVFLQIMPAYVQAAAVNGSMSTGPAATTNTSSVSNVTDTVANKIKGPSVKIAFTSDNYFKEGSKVTATATANGFYDDSEKLYYTWYIKHKECGLTSGWEDEKTVDNNEEKLKTCDLDGDKKISPNDWKIAAARFVVKGNFDRKSADYSSVSAAIENGSGTEAVPGVTDEDKDWIVNFKRDDDGKLAETNGKDAPNCYVQNPKSGRIYELTDVEPDFSNNSCPEGYKPSCLKDTTTSCSVLNPAFVTAAENPTDPEFVKCWPENLVDNPSYDPVLCKTPKSITQSFNVCAITGSAAVADMASIFQCGNTDPATDPEAAAAEIETYQANISCKDGGIAMCAKTSGNTKVIDLSGKSVESYTDPDQDRVVGVIFNSETAANMCREVAKANPTPITIPPSILQPPPNFLDNLQPAIDADHEACGYLANALTLGLYEKATVNGLVVDNLQTLVEPNANLKLSCTYGKGEGTNSCKHLFPYFPKQSGVPVDSSTNVDMGDAAAGDGKFGLEEKKFWWANPAVVSTKEKGIPDEASVIGLGIDSMSWTYMSGDEIGLVVEGTTTSATEHEDATYRTMWAFSKNTCTALEKIEEDQFYTENSGIIGIRVTSFDLDKCLEENLEVPGDKGMSSMETTLKATPSDLINDPTGMSSSLAKITASAGNSVDLNSIYYTWSIERPKLDTELAEYPDENTEFAEITDEMITNESLTSADTEGLGKDELKFLLNLPEAIVKPTEGIFYLRIRVTSKENSGEEEGKGNQTSTGSLIIKVKQQGNETTVSSVNVEEGSVLTLADGEPLCDAEDVLDGTKPCEVPQNKIIGIKIKAATGDTLSGTSWTVNNVSMRCDSSMSADCGDGNVLIFPILGNVGESVRVVASAISSKTGGTTEIVRNFLISEPKVTIKSANLDNAWPKLLGYFRDLTSNASCFEDDTGCTADYSEDIFETNNGNTAKFTAEVSSLWPASSYEWTLDGEIQESTGETSDEFTVEKTLGDSYNIGLTAKMVDFSDSEQIKKINSLRNALLTYWGVSAEDSVGDDENLSANIQLNVTDTEYVASADSNEAGIFASLITNLPENLMFLLKIVLTSVVLMFFMTLLFAFIPESVFEKKEEENQ